MNSDAAAENAWRRNVLDLLNDFGWDCRSLPSFSKIDACRLVVNVYKHGKGPSLEDLAKRYPEYLDNGFLEGARRVLDSKSIDHEWLSISEAQFDEIADGLRQFWVMSPERLWLKEDGGGA